VQRCCLACCCCLLLLVLCVPSVMSVSVAVSAQNRTRVRTHASTHASDHTSTRNVVLAEYARGAQRDTHTGAHANAYDGTRAEAHARAHASRPRGTHTGAHANAYDGTHAEAHASTHAIVRAQAHAHDTGISCRHRRGGATRSAVIPDTDGACHGDGCGSDGTSRSHLGGECSTGGPAAHTVELGSPRSSSVHAGLGASS
jgi:hypothetical protein